MIAKDGGPAFPTTEYLDGSPVGISGGLSLRDYFAAQALIGFFTQYPREHGVAHTEAPKLAADCYVMADAMLAERAK